MANINFAQRGLTGPSTFDAAGPAQPLLLTVTAFTILPVPVTVGISGGVLLGDESNLTMVDPTVYATASPDSGGDHLSPAITINFSIPISGDVPADVEKGGAALLALSR
jgi:hypothetical protein